MRQRSPLLPIFLIVLVDVLGFTIVIPLLALYAEKFGASPLVATTLVSVYAMCSLVSTPLIGSLSDRYGRRPLLLASQAGTCAGFLVLGTASALWMVFVGRILDGITAGNLSTAQAYISDHTKPEDRAKAFGVIGVAFGIGFMFGPGLGGWLGGAYGMHVPFIVSACLSALSMICTYTLLPRELPPQAREAHADAAPGGKRPGAFDFATYGAFLRRPGLGPLYLQFFLFTFAFSAFTSGFALFAEARFGWGARQTGYLFTYAGLLGIVLQGGLIGRLVKRFGEVRLALAGFVAAIAGYTFLGLAQSIAFLLVAATVNSFGSGVLRPVLTSQITQRVGRHEQGVAIGISGSLSSLAMTLAPPSGGAMLDAHQTLAWALVPATMSVFGLIVALANRRSARAAPAT
ncbi:MAG TPA: MFS transporter [Kofleriaceae bacterium]|nr:MFS transporter [Kofleriaceae bacterium]